MEDSLKERFNSSFYNWMLDNGMDIYTKGSESMLSSLGTPWVCEIDPPKLKSAIEALVNAEVEATLERLKKTPHSHSDGPGMCLVCLTIDDELAQRKGGK